MLEDARELVRSERARGRSTARVVVRICFDVLRSAPREWWQLRGDASDGSANGRPSGHTAWWGASIGHDARAALRQLARQPGFSSGLVLLLGVVIGSATAVSAVIGSYLLRPLPYPHADRLVVVQPVVPVSVREVGDLFEVPVTWDLDAFTLVGEESSELVYGSWISPGYFEAFGVSAARGRLFTADETGPGGSAVAVISHELWQRRWGADPEVLGRTVGAFTSDRPHDAELFTIVGVLPEGLWHYNRYTEFFTPLRADNSVYLGRLRADVPAAEAARILEQRGRRQMESVPEGFRVRLVPLQAGYTEPLRPLLSVGALAVVLMLGVAWANAAVLLLIRSQKRARDLWLRRALGAGRLRLARQTAIEALMLCATAAGLGALLSAVVLDKAGPALQASLGRTVPGGLSALRLDTYALGTLAALTALSIVIFTLAPLLGAALRTGERGAAMSLRGGAPGRARNRARGVLVTAEIALSMALLVSGILAVRSARHLAHLDLGFDAEGVHVSNLLLRARSYPEGADRVAFYDRVTAGAMEIPGVESAAVGVLAPFRWAYAPQPVEAEPGEATSPALTDAARLVIGPGWLQTMRIRVLSGRGFGAEDGAEVESVVVVVSEELARRLWPGADALGRRLRLPPGPGAPSGADLGPWHTVIGVVSEIRGSFEGSGTPAVYLPIAQAGTSTVTLVLRTRAGSPDPLPSLRAKVGAVDPTVALYASGWLSESVAAASRASRFLAALLGSFSTVAVALAVVGLYAVLAFAASQRRRDIAVRMALGARVRSVTGQFLADGLKLAIAGVLLGTAGAALLARQLVGQLHGVSVSEPGTYAAAASLVLLVATLAIWVPSQRAASVDPMDVLREE
jgi:predicted permease